MTHPGQIRQARDAGGHIVRRVALTSSLTPSVRVRQLVDRESTGALALTAAIPFLFLHERFQPEYGLELGTTTVDDAPLRAMLAETFPSLVDAPIVKRRICTYCDTVDGNFWIARHPDNPKLVVATGGSGHAFKFAPVLGDVIAAIALGEPHPLESRFRWRPDASPSVEAARYAGEI